MNRHLISAADLSRDDAMLILDTAAELASVAGRPIRKLPTLRGLTVVNCFYEDSTRTRTSFEAAAKRLSADVINFSAKGSSVAKGESLKDTALTLEAMGADAVVIRHSASGAAHTLARWVTGSVVNAGRRHPRAPHPGAARRVHDAPAARRGRRAGPRHGPGRAAGDDRGRRAAQPGGQVQRAAAQHARGRGDAGGPADADAVRGRELAVQGQLRPGRGAAQGRRGDDAAGAAGADERGVLPEHPRVPPPVRARHRADGAAARARHRDAPGPDEPRRGDRRRGRGLAAVDDRGAGEPTGSSSGWPFFTCCSAAPARGRRHDRGMADQGRLDRRRPGRRRHPPRRRRDRSRRRGHRRADGARPRRPGPDRAARPRRPAHAPARAGQRGRRDGGDRHQGRRARRLHRGARDGEHRAGGRHRRGRRAGLAARPAGRVRRRPPGRRGHRGPERQAARGARRDGRLGRARSGCSPTTATASPTRC